MVHPVRRSCRLGFVILLVLAGVVFLAAAIPGAGAQGGGSASGLFIAVATSPDLMVPMQDIAVVRPDGSGFRNLTEHPAGGENPFWTSDGRWLVYEPYWRVHPDGTGRERLRGGFSDFGDVVSFDGRLMEVGGVIRDMRGHLVRNLWPRIRARGYCDFAGTPVWSPDGRYLAFNVYRCKGEEVVVAVIVRTGGRGPVRGVARQGHDVWADSFSPDGRRVLVVDDAGRSRQALLVSTRTGARHQLPGGIARANAVAWSPDGQRFAYIAHGGGLWVVRAADGLGGRRLATVKQAGLAWGPRGDRIAVCDRTGLHLVRVATGRTVTLTRLCKGTTPAWEPRERALTFSTDEREIFTVSVPTGHLRRVVGAPISADWPTWAPDRRHIAFARGPHGMRDEGTLGVYVVDPGGGGLQRLGRGYDPQWSPDSRRVVYVDPLGTRDPPGDYASGRIMIASLDGGGRKQVATGTAPVWSPDGQTIAFMRYTFSKQEGDGFGKGDVVGSSLFLVGSDGSGEHVLAQSANWGDAQFWPQWAPDGSAIAVDERLFDEAVYEGGEGDPLTHRVTLVDPRTGVARRVASLVSNFEISPGGLRWSPDSQQILVSELGNLYAEPARPARLRLLDVATASFRTLVEEDPNCNSFETACWSFASPVWSPDGTRVAYLRDSDEHEPPLSDVWTVRQDGTGRQRLLKTPANERWLAWAPTVPPLQSTAVTGG